MLKSSVYSKREVCKDVRTKFLIFSVALRNIDYLIKNKTIIITTYILFMFERSEIIEGILNRNEKCVNLKNDY